MQDLVERLRRKEQRLPAQGGGMIGINADGKTVSSSYITDDGYRLVNPDGPEAADEITALRAALEQIAKGRIADVPDGLVATKESLTMFARQTLNTRGG